MGALRGDGRSSSGGPQRSELAAKTRQQKGKNQTGRPAGDISELWVTVYNLVSRLAFTFLCIYGSWKQ